MDFVRKLIFFLSIFQNFTENFSENFRLIFEPRNTNTSMFSLDACHSMCTLYGSIILDDIPLDIQNSEPVSLGLYAALLTNKSSCLETSENDIDYLNVLLQQCAPYYISGELRSDCTETQCPTIPVNCSLMSAAFNVFHYLLPSGAPERIKNGDFYVDFTLMITPVPGNGELAERIYAERIQGRKDLHDDVTQISAVGGSFKFDLLSRFLLSDMKFVGVGVGMIILIIWLYTGSLFVTLMTMMNMVMSLVWSYFLYVVVIRISFFPFINILTVILLLGIGADGTFVYMDLWRKFRSSCSHEGGCKVKILQETLRHASITLFVTSLTTSSALLVNVISSITAIKCFGLFSGCTILFNFVFTITWLPAVVEVQDKYWERICNNKTISSLWRVNSLLRFTVKLRRFFEESIPKVVFKLRYIWLFIFTLLSVGGACVIFIYPKLKIPSQAQFQVFVTSEYAEQYDKIFRENLDFEKVLQEKMPITFCWGVIPTDNGNPWDPDDRGSIVLDERFDLSAPESQEWLLHFCSVIKMEDFYSNTTSDQLTDFCFIDGLKAMMEGPCDNQTISANVVPCCNTRSFPYDAELFHTCASLYVSLTGTHQALRFNADNRLTGLTVSFTSNTTYTLNYESISEFWNAVNEWGEEEFMKAPSSMSGGWFSSYIRRQLYFFDLQNSLITGTPLSIAMSLGVAALVLLITTRNVLITLCAVLSISGAVFVTIGSMVLIGWELNILESTIMSLAVGLSVDFTIHYGVAYRIAPSTDRASRSEYAMKQLTSAISAAAFSTFVAGACMIPATVLAYQQIGIFLTLVMTCSWFFGTFFFMSLCRALGPNRNCAQITLCCEARSNSCYHCQDDIQ